tara:strand:+ start:1185 stop:1526 length:342 start_codon:yes stop_codon:yes gene_type:complete
MGIYMSLSRNIILDIKEIQETCNRGGKLFKYPKHAHVEYYSQRGWIKSKILSCYREKGINKYHIELLKNRIDNDIFNCCGVSTPLKQCYWALSPELRSSPNILPFEEKVFQLQ